jgi:hypothetical protein
MKILLMHSDLDSETPETSLQWLPHNDARSYMDKVIFPYLEQLAKNGDRLAWKATDDGQIFHAPVRSNLEHAGFAGYETYPDANIKTLEEHILENLWISLHARQNETRDRAVANLMNDLAHLKRRVKAMNIKMPRAYKIAHGSLTARNLWNESQNHNSEGSE